MWYICYKPGYHSILRWKSKNGDTDEREERVKVKVCKVISNVDKDSTGTIEVKYIADKRFEAEWQEIKKCEPDDVQVRTSFLDGSPGRIRTYDLSVNSRLLCR